MEKGQRVRCVKDDPADDYYGIADELRWHIGDEFIIESIKVEPYGTFLYNSEGQNLNIKRAKLVK